MVRFVPSTHYFVESTLLCEQAFPDIVLWRAGLPPLQGSGLVRRIMNILYLIELATLCVIRLHALTCTEARMWQSANVFYQMRSRIYPTSAWGLAALDFGHVRFSFRFAAALK